MTVHPFTRVVDDDEVIIGRPERQVFVAVPPIGVEVLDRLAEGSTIRDTQAWIEAEYGEAPDIADFLENLERGGFVSPEDNGRATGEGRDSDKVRGHAADVTESPTEPGLRHHFEGFPAQWARRLFGAPALWIYLMVILGALAAIAARPEVMPGRSSLVFRSGMTLAGLALVALLLLTVFLHEMAHLVAARARGVSSRLGVGHRLWFLVVETDMTGLWRLPRDRRYLPILAGPLADATMASSLLLLLFVREEAGWAWVEGLSQIVEALVFLLLLRLVWQLFLFMRTDVYFLVASLFKCKNLMEDTRTFVWHLWMRLRGKKPVERWTQVPLREQRVVRWYAVFWFIGRGAAVAMFALVHLPVLVQYLVHSFEILMAGPGDKPLHFVDGLITFCVSISTAAAGLVLWLRSIFGKERV
ncbi:MAG: hypothetical protein PVG07_03820 [Acidobacteriota bacterium]